MKKKEKEFLRSVSGYLPLAVRKLVTKNRINSINEGLMSETDLISAADEEKRLVILEKYKAQYPKVAAETQANIDRLFKTSAIYGNMEKEKRDSIISDMMFCRYAYGFHVEEYVSYQLERDTDGAIRRSFISETERHTFRFAVNDYSFGDYSTKTKAYNRLKKYYKRGFLIVDSSNPDSLKAFLQRYPYCIKKPENLSGGRGITLINSCAILSDNRELKQLLDEAENTPIVIEEQLVQDGALKKFNPDTLNTVRLLSYYCRNGIVIKHGFFKTGRKGSIVDNGASGGIIWGIDSEKGKVVSEGFDELGYRYLSHPDSGEEVIGYCFPEWDKVLGMVTEAARETPRAKWLGWDLAYTPKYGWEIIEVNTSPTFLVQGSTMKSERQELRNLIDEMDLLVPFSIPEIKK